MTTRRSAALVIAALLLAAACSNADVGTTGGTSPKPNGPGTTYAGTNYDEHVPVDAPGVTDTEIRVGSITATTNPLGTDLGLLNDGIEAYFDTINAQGGIYGRKLKLTSKRDDQTVRNANEAQALLAQDNVYAAFIGSVLFTGAKLLARAGIPTFVCRVKDFAGREEWDAALAEAVAAHEPDLVVSAGFMKIVGKEFLARFGGRFVNTHPALLPSFPGAHGVRDALAYGARVTGCTVHFVDDGVDTGPIIAQGVVEVRDEDDESALHERIKEVERRLLVDVVGRLARNGYRIEGRKVVIQ